jgi:23S rRNA (uracil-5-)-methyltransferase RumA
VLSRGQNVELSVEKPAAGGRMIARHDGEVVLVSGAIPGERVLVRVERAERRLAFASVVDVREESPDRRAAFADSSCGGCVYSHVVYPRQLGLKADIVRDAFLRLGRIPIDGPISVAPSLERGYRMRARFHVDGTRFGFYREGTHTLCDAASTGQVTDTALESVSSAVETLVAAGARIEWVELTESVDGSERALAVAVDDVSTIAAGALESLTAGSRLVGCAIQDRRSRVAETGTPSVADALSLLTRGRVPDGRLRRHAASFFQANRFLVPDLVLAVMDAVVADGLVLDLYAGVGLFSIALAASGRRGVAAVEGDRMSGADLDWNARNVSAPEAVPTVILDSVERYLAARQSASPRVATVIVDPPRTGISAEAMASLLKRAAPRLVYVSCDPATLARDARRLLDGGYVLDSLRAFDLFPNTPHVECLACFSRPSVRPVPIVFHP